MATSTVRAKTPVAAPTAVVTLTLPSLRGSATVTAEEPGLSVETAGEVPRPTAWAIRCVLSLGAAAVLLALALRRISCESWGATWVSISGVAPVGLVLLTAFTLGAWFLGRDDRPAGAIGRLADRVCARLCRAPEVPGATRAVGVRRDCASLVGSGWGRLVGAKPGYTALQAVLLWLALRLLGVSVSLAVVLAAYAAERILSMVVLTSSAAGLLEARMAGTLVALHAPAAAAVAGVLLIGRSSSGWRSPSAACGWPCGPPAGGQLTRTSSCGRGGRTSWPARQRRR